MRAIVDLTDRKCVRLSYAAPTPCVLDTAGGIGHRDEGSHENQLDGQRRSRACAATSRQAEIISNHSGFKRVLQMLQQRRSIAQDRGMLQLNQSSVAEPTLLIALLVQLDVA